MCGETGDGTVHVEAVAVSQREETVARSATVVRPLDKEDLPRAMLHPWNLRAQNGRNRARCRVRFFSTGYLFGHSIGPASVRWSFQAEQFIFKEQDMTKRNAVIAGLLGLGMFCGGVALAQRPAENVSPRRHPNLAAAQRLVDQAFKKIVAAQEANEWDLNGHAQKAKELLDEANRELKEAAEASNQNHR